MPVEKRPSTCDEEEEFRQLAPNQNLQLFNPSLTTGSGKHKNVEQGLSADIHGSMTDIVRLANRRSNRMQLTMSILANLTVLSSGMGLGYSAITLHSLTKAGDPMSLGPEQASWFVSVNSFACPFGGLLSGVLLDRIGRKKTLVFINVLSIVSWTLMAVASRSNFELMYTQIMIARVIIGLVIGLVSAPAAIYSAEIALPHLRGRLTILTSLAIAVGILIIYTFGYFIPENFRLVAGLAAGCCVLSLALLIPMPESPVWLMSKEREPEAERSLKRIRGYGTTRKVIPEIEHELKRLKDRITLQKMAGKERLWDMIRQPQVYKPLGVIIGFFGFQQFSGIFVVVVYAAKVSSEAGVMIDPFLCTVLIGVTRVVATVLVAYILDSLGRKPPSIFSGCGMTICMFGIAGCIYFPLPEELSWVPTFLIITYIFTSTLGFLTMPFSMMAELFPLKVRGPASGISVFFTYVMSFIIIKLYPTMVAGMQSANVFIFYGVISLLGVIFVCLFVPETKGKSLEEIEAHFRGKQENKRPNSDEEDSIELSSSSAT
ncbi:facilitated trehalose transporter Tret1-2 homolog [Uranotaenia lowii]|uniref:facilitated trehalose transporter Tret1-2 homolog n=1 Tax=Uranotaenia lowii TaxID=190385 RepID=UPI002478F588|nr:facilitated trehalose transporter Tret1-2 homolog [Uranotaenia lowii]